MEISVDDETKRERRREYTRRYNERHPERRKEQNKKYNNSPEAKARRAEWVENNMDRYLAAKKRWQNKNKEYYYQQTKKYRQENPGFTAKCCAKRRARKLMSTPTWLDEDHLWWIDEVYELATLRTKATGIDWHVDHIVPLQGRKVCGLHVPWNLQVITASENSKKGNKFES